MYDLNHWQSKRWEKDRRYYVAEVTQDLFGAWQLVQRWGRTATRLGASKSHAADSHADALAQLDATAKRRAARGYRETEHG